MVGYHKYDSLTTTQKLFAGCLSGVITRFITQPLDIIKLRTQVQKFSATKKTRRMTKTARKILVEEGVGAFWHGHMIGQLHSILAVSSQFYVYEIMTQFCGEWERHPDYRPYVRFCCGVFAGCCSASLVLPLEVIRVRQMLVKEQYSSLYKGASAVYRYGGILAFYEGLSAAILQLGPQVGLSFVVFSYVQPAVLQFFEPPSTPQCPTGDCVFPANRYSAQNLLIASTVAGSLAGFVSKTCTYPLDLAKRRLQIGSHKVSPKYQVPSTSQNLIKCSNLADCIAKTVKKEGIPGLFRGWSITIWKAQVTSVVAFTTYELLCYGVREYNASF